MADTLELEIVTPEKLMVREQVEEVQIPGKAGYMDILPLHAPLISELTSGEITYKSGGNTQYLAVGWGFVEVLPDKVTVLAQTAERANEINVQRAQEAKSRAEQDLQSQKPDLDYDATLAALKRAEVRLEVAQHTGQTRR
jgi:F-type H+-transporting ATPase subunit epsilon